MTCYWINAGNSLETISFNSNLIKISVQNEGIVFLHHSTGIYLMSDWLQSTDPGYWILGGGGMIVYT